MAGLLAVLLWTGAALAQDNPERAAGMVESGDELLAAHDLAAARVQYERALRTDRGHIDARRGLGLIALRERDWSAVDDHFAAVLEADPDDQAALLYRSMAQRERGRYRTPLDIVKELTIWRRAERGFEAVIEQDSSFQDALYQYALLERYRGDWARALTLAHRQLALRPDLGDAVAGLARFYELMAVEGRSWSAEERAQWPAGWATYYEALLLREAGRLEDAEATLAALLSTRGMVRPTLVHLERARLAAQQGAPRQAEAHYWAAVEAIERAGDAALVFDVTQYVLTGAERHAFAAASSSEAWQRYFRSIWARRDPLPAAATNARLAEHYERLAYAYANYAIYREQAYYNNPDTFRILDLGPGHRLNQTFNDLGLLYLRHGEPDETVVTHENENAEAFGVRRQGQVRTPETVLSWRYREREAYPELIFHFESLAGNNWRLVPTVATTVAMMDRIEWGHLYNPRLINPSIEQQMIAASQEAVDAAFASDRHTWASDVESLDLRDLVASFRGTDGTTRVEVHYAFPVNQFASVADASGLALMEAGLAIHDSTWAPVSVQTDDKRVRLTGNAGDASIGYLAASVPPQAYHVAVHVRAPGNGLVGGRRFDLDVPDFSAPRLAMSDVLPAFSVTPAVGDGPDVRRGFRVVPNPTRIFPRAQPVPLYFEIYHLTFDGEETQYRLRYALEKERGGGFLRRLFRRGDATVLAVESTVTGAQASPAEIAELDVQDLDAGTYVLRVTVTDVHTGASAERTREIRLF